MGAFYVFAGVSHFTQAGFFRQIVPPFLPNPALVVVVSGIAEIVLGALVMVPATRRMAAWGIIALLIAVWPANFYQALYNPTLVDPPAWIGHPTQTALLIRLPLQLVLMYWAWRYTR
jgi:uncharacterized membrane protein